MNDRNGSSDKKAGAKQQGKRRKSRGRGRSKKVDPLKYWGDRDLLSIPDTFELETPDTSVVATSLGRPPIPGQENASKHYFGLVYDRAALLAGALAAAGDLENMAARAEQLREELEDAAGDDPESDDAAEDDPADPDEDTPDEEE